MSRDTEQLIQKHLEVWANRFQFEFCAVNMRNIEERWRREDPDLLSALSRMEVDHLEGLKLPKQKIQWISGRYAVKSALFKFKAGYHRLMDVRGIDVIKGADSAPHLLQYPGLFVSITHSHPYCIGVISEARIGIDLEAVFQPTDSLIHYFYSDAEQSQLRNCHEMEARSIQSIIFWTRKEAVSKLLGLGMKLDFKGIDTIRDEISISSLPSGISPEGVIHLVSCVCNDFCLSTAVFTPSLVRSTR